MSATTDPLAAVRRSDQAYYEQITEQVALSCGVALVCPRYPGLRDGNHLREMVIPPGGSAASAFAEVEAFYGERGLTCHRWVPAATQPIEPVEAFLVDRGFITRRLIALACRTPPEPPEAPVPEGVRILPGRAMRPAVEALSSVEPGDDAARRAMLAEAHLDRLDDPQYDLSVAVAGGAPAGRAALHQVGEIGRIRDVYVAEPFRRRGIGLALMSHTMALSRRLAMRITVAEAPEEDAAALAFSRRCGFEPAGTRVEFLAPAAVR